MRAHAPADRSAMPDDELLAAARGGDASAFGLLWQRHAAVARATARAVTRISEPDDLVSEAFAAILGVVRRGGGPTSGFRPYLLQTVRNLAAKGARGAQPIAFDDTIEEVLAAVAPDRFDEVDTRALLKAAFARLPQRQRDLLWMLEVEGLKPREVATAMGMTSNAVSALAYRAREGLRSSWAALAESAAPPPRRASGDEPDVEALPAPVDLSEYASHRSVRRTRSTPVAREHHRLGASVVALSPPAAACRPAVHRGDGRRSPTGAAR